MKKIYCLFLILMATVGCYEDKGNYKYSKDVIDITIDLGDSYINSNIGDEIRVEPIITPDISKDSRYTFRWYINEDTKEEWNKKDFVWVPDIITDANRDLTFEITDTRYNMKYSKTAFLTIEPKYISNTAWLVLSDDAGESKLHFLKYTKRESREDPVIPSDDVWYPVEWSVEYDVYGKQNNNESLGNGPIGIQEHFIDFGYGQYCIFQQSGAIDVEARYLRKDIPFSLTFDGGTYPTGVNYLASGNMMMWMDAMTDQNGRIFTRFKYDSNVYNTGKFSPDPVKYNGEVLTDCFIFRNSYQGGYTLFHDRLNGRIMMLLEGNTGGFWDDDLLNAGKIMNIPEPDILGENCRAYDNFKDCEILSVSLRAYWGENTISVVYKDPQGKIMFQRTYFYMEELVPSDLNTEAYELEGAPTTINKVFMPVFFSGDFAFLIDDNKIYLVDFDDEYKAFLYYTADSKITSLDAVDFNYVMFVTEGGFFYDLDISNAKNKITELVPDEKKLLFKLGGFGKTVDMKQIRNTDHGNY